MSTKPKGLGCCPCCVFLGRDLFIPLSSHLGKDSKESLTPASESLFGETPDANINQQRLLANIRSAVIDTHSHAHLERRDEDSRYCWGEKDIGLSLVSCSVEVADWDVCLDFAAQSNAIIPALGVHPWYCGDLDDDGAWVGKLERLLQQHPGCLVGEIGLCKIARWVRAYPGGRTEALEKQRRVFVKQLELAAHYERPVSVHCVQQHGVLADLFGQLEEWPPTIAMHSFTGTAHHVRKLLQLEQGTGAMFYFGFSHAVNYAMCSSEKSRRQTNEAIRAVPRDRLLVESDVHRTDAVLAGTYGAISYLADVLGEDLESVAHLTHTNGLNFVRQKEYE